MIDELKTVVLTRDIASYNLKAGDLGSVVHTYEDGQAAEVEFVTAEGKTAAVLTLSTSEIRPVGKSYILHARSFAGA